MKRIVLVALALALLPGLAFAQNINRSLQGSQDPRGPVGIDTSNSAYFPNHINAYGNTSGSPTVVNCGTGAAMGSGSTDAAGAVTAEQTTCTVKFGSPFNNAPYCVTQVNSTPSTTGTPSQEVVTATTSFSLTAASSGVTYSYICIGNQ